MTSRISLYPTQPSLSPHSGRVEVSALQKKSERSFKTFSDEEQLLDFLSQHQISDGGGAIFQNRASIALPPLPRDILAEFLSVLHAPQAVIIGDKTVTFTLIQLLEFVKEHSTLESIGGWTRQQLMKHKGLLSFALQKLTGQPPEAIETCLTDSLLQEGGRTLPDIDLRVLCPQADRQELYDLIQKVAEFFAKETGESIDWVKRHQAFYKFNVPQEDGIYYSIVSFGKAECPIELIFWKSSSRPFLFSTDALHFSLTDLPSTPHLTLKSELGTGWQSLIDLLTKVIRIPNPHTINKFGFPLLISYFSRSYVLARSTELPILRDHSLELSANYFDKGAQITTLLSKTFDNHHHADADAAVVFACNASFYLKDSIPPESLKQLCLKLIGSTPSHPLLKEIAHAALEDGITIDSCLDALAFGAWAGLCTRAPKSGISLRQHAGSIALQIYCPDMAHCLLIPWDFEKSLHTLIKALQSRQQNERLLNIIEEIVFQNTASPSQPLDLSTLLGLEPEKFEGMALELLQSNDPGVEYLGFLLLSALFPHSASKKKSLQILIEKVIPMSTFRKDGQKLLLFWGKLCTATGHKTLASILTTAAQELTEKDPEKTWILALAESKDPTYCRQSASLWKKHRLGKKIPERSSFDLQLISLLLPLGFEEGVHLFRNYLRENTFSCAPKEMEIVQLVMHHTNLLSSQQFSVMSPTINDALATILTQSFIEGMDTSEPLCHYICRLTKTGQFTAARSLIELVPAAPYMQKAWTLWLEELLAQQHLKTASEEFHQLISRLKSSASNPQQLHEEIYWNAIEKLLRHPPAETFALKVLKHSYNENSQVARISGIAQNFLKSLISTDRSKEASEALESHFHLFFTPLQLQANREHLLAIHLKKNDLTLAIAVWKLLITSEKTEALHKLTIRLFDVMMASRQYLPQLFECLRMQDPFKILSTESKVSYQLQLFDTLGETISQPLCCYLLKTIFEETSQMRPEIETEAALRVLLALESLDSLSTSLKKILGARLKKFLRALDASLYSRFIMQLDKHQLPLSDLCLPTLFNICHQAASDSQHPEELFFWIESGKKWSSPSEAANWIGNLSESLHKTIKAKFYLTYRQELLSVKDPEKVVDDAIQIARLKETLPSHAIALLEAFVPHYEIKWKALFQNGNSRQLMLVWQAFSNSLSSILIADSVLEDALLCGLKRLEKGKSPHLITLLNHCLDDESSLCRLFRSNKSLWLKICTTIFKGSLPIVKEDPKLTDLVLKLYQRSGADEQADLPDVEDIIDVLVALNFEKGQISALILLDKHLKNKPEAASFEAYHQLAFSLIKAANNFQESNLAIEINKHLCGICIALRTHFAQQINFLDYAEELALIANAGILTQCRAFLDLIHTTRRYDEMRFGRILGSWLLQCIDSQMNLENPVEQKFALAMLTAHTDLLRPCEIAFKKCRDKAIEILIKQIVVGNVHTNDCLETIRHFTSTHVHNVQHLETPFKLKDCPVFIFPEDNPLQPEMNGQADHFFTFMHTFLIKFIDSALQDESSRPFVNYFISQNLINLCERFPSKRPPLVDLFDRLIYRTPPEPTTDFSSHLLNVLQAFWYAVRIDIYEESGEKMIEHLLYLDRVVGRTDEINPKALKKPFITALDKCLSFSSPYALMHAASMMQGCQHIILHNDPETLISCYEKLLSFLKKHPFPAYHASMPFEWVGSALLNAPYIVHPRAPNCERAATRLATMLFDATLEIMQRIQRDSPYEKYQVIGWLFEFLMETLSKGAFCEEKGSLKLIHLTERLTQKAIKEIFNVPLVVCPSLFNLVTNGILTLVKSNPKKRCELVSQWITAIASFKHLALLQLKEANKQEAFSKFAPQLNKLQETLKRS